MAAIVDKKEFAIGMGLMASFVAVLIFMFTPSFKGKNAFQASDDLFNTISKGSAYFIPAVRAHAGEYAFDMDIEYHARSEKSAEYAVMLLEHAGLTAHRAGEMVQVRGELTDMVNAALDDADLMFYNKSGEMAAEYNIPEDQAKEALGAWVDVLAGAERALTKQSKFDRAKYISQVKGKGVEPAYNYLGITPESAKSKAGILTFALAFYVIYTLWYGFAIFYLFESLGLKMTKGKKKEV